MILSTTTKFTFLVMILFAVIMNIKIDLVGEFPSMFDLIINFSLHSDQK